MRQKLELDAGRDFNNRNGDLIDLEALKNRNLNMFNSTGGGFLMTVPADRPRREKNNFIGVEDSEVGSEYRKELNK